MQDSVNELKGLMKYHPQINNVSVDRLGEITIDIDGNKKSFLNMINLLEWTETNLTIQQNG